MATDDNGRDPMIVNESDRSTNGYEIAAAGEPPPRAHMYDYLIILARHRWKLGAFVIIGTVLVAAYTFVQPQTFSASALLMPPEEEKGMSFSALLGKSAGLDFQSLGKNSSAEIFVKILSSRTLADSLIDRHGLIRRYGLTPGQRELARQRLSGELEASSDRDGLISIAYHAKTGYMSTRDEQRAAAKFSAEVVNSAIELLDRLNREKHVTSARRSREFIGRMKQIKRAEMTQAQDAMLRFQRANKAIALDQQVEASVTALAEIQALKQKTELELRAAQTELTDATPRVRALEAQLRQLAAQQSKIETGTSGSAPFALNMRNVPGLAKDYATLKLDLEVATQVYTFLEAQYHQEQVQEARDLPTVNALDPAVVPEMRSSPRRAITLLVAFPILLVGGIVIAFIFDALRRQSATVDPERAIALREALGGRRGVARGVNGEKVRN
jgi:tyrosine-protein kinase Etk/Wzc